MVHNRSVTRSVYVVGVLIGLSVLCDAVSISWKAVNDPGQAIPVFRNSHSTAEYSTDRLYEAISGNYIADDMP